MWTILPDNTRTSEDLHATSGFYFNSVFSVILKRETIALHPQHLFRFPHILNISSSLCCFSLNLSLLSWFSCFLTRMISILESRRGSSVVMNGQSSCSLESVYHFHLHKQSPPHAIPASLSFCLVHWQCPTAGLLSCVEESPVRCSLVAGFPLLPQLPFNSTLFFSWYLIIICLGALFLLYLESRASWLWEYVFHNFWKMINHSVWGRVSSNLETI